MESIEERLRHVKITGTIRSVDGMKNLAEQFAVTASECDSSAHEVAAMALRWGAEQIQQLESLILRIQREIAG